ncbi:MAG: HNH endonuclease motif protein [Enterobacter phage ENC19]|nr:MAG: HNH endonuclease motif protein [Enterobacter phage ENC19]
MNVKSHGGNNRTLEEEIEGINFLLEYVDVHPTTGNIIWKRKPSQRIKLNSVAGYNSNGYWIIGFKGKNYLRHRIVFYYVNGYLPLVVDHVDGVDAGDHIGNLQEATQQQNTMKKAKSKRNTSGIRGVCLHKPSGKWQSRIMIDGKYIQIGMFSDIIDAKNAYNKKAKELFGDFYVEQ